MNLTRKTLFTLCAVLFLLLAGLLLRTRGLSPQAVLAQSNGASGITAPEAGAAVGDTVPIIGTAAHEAFQRYELYFKASAADDDAYIYFAEGNVSVVDGQLGLWDTTDLEPGAYVLRMRVVRSDGNYAEYIVPDLQVGQTPAEPTAPLTTTVPATPTATAIAAPTAVITPTAVGAEATAEPAALPAEAAQILVDRNLNVRAGPGIDTDIVNTLGPGDRALITGQNAGGEWWQITINGASGWVLGRLVTAENTDGVPVIEGVEGVTPPAAPTATAVADVTPETAAEVPTEVVPEVVPEIVVVEEVAVPAPIAAGGPVTVTLAGDVENTDALRNFLRMLLLSISPSNTVVTGTIGLLPAELPITLTVPQTATVIGGVVRTGDFAGSQLFLATGSAADALLVAVRQQLLDQGFTSPPQGQTPGGSSQLFLSSDSTTPDLLCSPDETLAVTVNAVVLADGATAVAISTNPVAGFGGPCGADPAGDGSEIFDALPQLLPPPQAQVRGSGVGSSSGTDGFSVTAEAEIESALTVAELTAHYTGQLAETGWAQVAESQTDALAWSAWSFVDGNDNGWNATFYIVQQGGEPGSYVATLRAENQ
jgi:uncharacterized protein YraI